MMYKMTQCFFSLSPFLVASGMEYLYIATDRIFVSCVMEGRGAIIVNCVWVSYICIRDGIFMSQSRDARCGVRCVHDGVNQLIRNKYVTTDILFVS